MRILYIYPHPDDESFGPATVMFKQHRQGHEVYLLTLTRGGATRVRHQLGLSIDEMGEVRYKEMLDVERVLKLSGMTILDLPDSRLKELDPREIEKVVEEEIRKIRPHIIVTYPVHGVSGFHDHLITHGVVKRVYVELREELPELQRLALIALTPEQAEVLSSERFRLQGSTDEEIDCVVTVDPIDIEVNRDALRCYASYMGTIDGSNIMNRPDIYPFELFGEEHTPPLDDLTTGLKDHAEIGGQG